MKRFFAIISGLLMALSLMVFNPAPAQAGFPCNSWEQCGYIKIADVSNHGLLVTYSWADPGKTSKWLNPGQASSLYGKDMDGFYLGSNRELWCRDRNEYGVFYWWKEADANQWHKRNDLFYENYCKVTQD